jgi:DNA-binding response OmpR family regulator
MPKLLVIDDEIDILDFAKSYFKRRGIEVFTASDGKEALRIIQEKNPDLVLLDFNMSDMTGVEVLRKIREELKLSTKVIMVTGMDLEMVINDTKGYDIRGFIHKPLVLEDLEKIVLRELNA